MLDVAPPPDPQGAPIRVLLVEDSDDDALLVAIHLRRYPGGVEMERVRELAALEACLARGGWDIVLSDFDLEGFNGLAVLETVCRMSPALPLILVSAAVGEETAVQAMRAGARDYVMKSGLGRLAPAIEREVRESRARIVQEGRIARLTRVRAVLGAANAAMLRVRERAELFREACRIAVEHGGFAMAWMLVEEPGTLRVAAMHGVPEELLATIEAQASPIHALARAAIAADNLVVRNDLSIDATVHALMECGVGSLVILPLAAPGALVICVPERAFFDEEELRLLRELASDIAFTLAHIGQRERLDHLAYFDPLTGLANRSLFVDRTAQLIDAQATENRSLAVCVADIDRFAAVNASFGRHVGDAILREAGLRLAAMFDAAHVGRVGADEFAVVMPRLAGEGDAARAVREGIARAFATPIVFEGREITLSVRVGAALFPSDGADAAQLLANADAAAVRAKAVGEASLFYNLEMTTRVAARLQLEGRLRRALERNEFELHYQPKVRAADRRIVGAEALIRWRSPETGLVSPAQFVPLLEETGLILPVGDWVMQEAARTVRHWRTLGLEAPRTAVNVSMLQLQQPDFVDRLARALGAGDPEIDLEIVESMAMADPDDCIAKLSRIGPMGVRVFVDDFGTGYSSLAYLARLPIQGLKIDRSFVAALPGDRQAHALASTIVVLSRSLDLLTVAEGVETEEQASALHAMGCGQLQGYLLGRPMPAEAFQALLERDRADGGAR